MGLSDEDIALWLYLRNKRKQRKRRRWYIRPVNLSRFSMGHFRTLISELRSKDPELYFRYFRMDPSKFDYLVSLVEPYLTKRPTHRMPITAPERLAITLRLMATGDSQLSIAMAYRIGYSTVNKIFRETVSALWDALQPLFVPVPTSADLERTAAEFGSVWNFPNCIGALDGKHIQIKAPHGSGSLFFNYKNTHSIVLMAVVDASYCFSYVDVGALGSQSDGGVFKSCPFGKALAEGTLEIPPPSVLPGTDMVVEHVFVGDEAFPLMPNLMKPFPRRELTYEKRIYNYRHCRARRISENGFGIMSARWRILLNKLEVRPGSADYVVKGCVALHNFLMKQDNHANLGYAPPNYADRLGPEGELIEGQWRNEVGGGFGNIPPLGSNNYRKTASAVRQKFVDYFNGPHGGVHWQEAIVRRGEIN